MPNFNDHPSTQVVRLLNIGESGAGKTGALASLVIAGYRLWVLDFDNGLDIIGAALKAHYKTDAEGLHSANSRIHYETLRDATIMRSGVPTVKSPPTAYKAIAETLVKWKAEEFGPSDVLVIDSLTTLTDAAFNQALMLAARLNQRPQLQDYGWLADSIKLLIQSITDADSMKCNVVLNSHIRYFGGDDESQTQARGLPNAKGQEISRIVSRYFNTVVLTRTVGTGPAAKRIISTKPQGVVEVKTSNPFGVKDQYAVTDGLAPLFADILGHGPQEISK